MLARRSQAVQKRSARGLPVRKAGKLCKTPRVCNAWTSSAVGANLSPLRNPATPRKEGSFGHKSGAIDQLAAGTSPPGVLLESRTRVRTGRSTSRTSLREVFAHEGPKRRAPRERGQVRAIKSNRLAESSLQSRASKSTDSLSRKAPVG